MGGGGGGLVAWRGLTGVGPACDLEERLCGERGAAVG